MHGFILTPLVAAVMLLVTCAIHYEAMAFATRCLPRLGKRPQRLAVAFVVCAMFVAHVVEITAFALCHYALYRLGMGSLGGVVENPGFDEFLYFSLISYSSLGLGEIYPTGMLRYLTGVEGLVGLLMIAWTASLTYHLPCDGKILADKIVTRRSGQHHCALHA